MEPQTNTTTPDATPAPGLRFTLATRFEAFCPCCGYSLNAAAIVLLSFDSHVRHGQTLIAGVCSRCYQNTLDAALDAAAILGNPLLADHVEHTHGVRFWMPADPAFQGQKALDVVGHLASGAPLYQQPYIDPPPQPADPDAGQGRLDYDTPPNADEPPAYDPPCPADVR